MTRRAQSGLSLVELMVGVLIGMLTVLAITQVLMSTEGRKRTTADGSDAQLNGTLALYALQRDVQMAGYGLTARPAAMGCTVQAQYGTGASPGLQNWPLVPARITFGANAATPDQLTLWMSSKNTHAVPLRVTENHAKTDTRFVVAGSFGSAAGDLVVAVPPSPSATSPCALMAIAGDSSTTLTNTQVPHLATANGWNAAGSDLVPTAGYPAGSHLINLGAGLPRTYRIDAAKALVATDIQVANGLSTTQTVAPQIVQLKALYGKDTDGNGTIDQFDAVTPTDNAGWRTVMALRVAVVARSAQFERRVGTSDPVTPAIGVEWAVDNLTSDGVACSTDTSRKCIRIDVSDVGADWQQYRYKVFDTVIPLRNMLWTR